MGSFISYILGWSTDTKVGTIDDGLGPDADIADSATGLSPRDVHLINKTWDVVRQDMKQHGRNFFIEFFKKHPETQGRFGPFGGIAIDELKKSRRLAGHGATVFSSIDSFIRNLDDPEVVVEMVKTVGVNHISRGVTAEEFGLVPDVLIAYMKATFGSSWNSQIETSWRNLLDLVTTIVLSVY